MWLVGVVTQKVVRIEDVVIWTDIVERYTALENMEAAANSSKPEADNSLPKDAMWKRTHRHEK